MSILTEIEGMKFPDEMVTRFFFKSGLHKATGTVLELGCGNGNNLSLFAAYGWQCVGMDIDPELIEQGLRNFSRQGYAEPTLIAGDLNLTLPKLESVDVLLMPSSIYYVDETRAREIILELAPIARGAQVFCRFRTPDDYRYGKGVPLGRDCFRLTLNETSESGCLNVFYDVERMLDVLAPFSLDTRNLKVMHLVFDNLGRDDTVIRNHDIVIWGKAQS